MKNGVHSQQDKIREGRQYSMNQFLVDPPLGVQGDERFHHAGRP